MKRMLWPVIFLLVGGTLILPGLYVYYHYDKRVAEKMEKLVPKVERYFLAKNLHQPKEVGLLANLMEADEKEISARRSEINSVYAGDINDINSEDISIRIYFFLKDGVVYYIDKSFTLKGYKAVYSRLTGDYMEVKWVPIPYDYKSTVWATFAFIFFFIGIAWFLVIGVDNMERKPKAVSIH